MSRPFAASSKGRAANDEWTFAREDREKTLVSGIEDLVAPEVVNIVLDHAILVGCVRADSVNSKIALNVVNHVRRVIDISDAWSRCCAKVLDRDRAGSGRRCSRGLAGRKRRGDSSFSRIGDVEALRVVVDDVSHLARQRERWMDGVQSDITGTAGTDTERRHFRHVDPEATERNALVPFNHLIDPPRNAVRGHPIREDSVPRPNRTNVLATIRVLKEHIRLVTPVVDIVRITSVGRVGNVDRRIDNRDKVLVVAMQPVKEILDARSRERDRIRREIAILVHVVDIEPDGLHGDAEVAERLDNLPELGPVAISPSALVVAEGPVLLHCGQANGRGLVLFGDLGLGRTVEEEEVNATSETPPGQVCGFENNVHAVRVAKVDAVRVGLESRALVTGGVFTVSVNDFGLLERLLGIVSAGLKVASLQVEWMTSIDVTIDWVTHVSSVNGGRKVVVQAEAVYTFTKTIEIVVLGQGVDKLDELILIDEVCAFGGEDDISGGLAGYCKPERWVIAPRKRKIEIFVRVLCLRSRNQAFRNTVIR